MATARSTEHRHATGKDWKLLFYHLGGPLLWLVDRRKLFRDTEVAVEAAQMQAYQSPAAAEIAPSRVIGA